MTASARIAALPRHLASNPYCDLLASHLEKLGVEVLEGETRLRWLLGHRGRVRVLHLHWPERHFDRRSVRSAVGFVVRMLCARAWGYRIVWTVHNAWPHEGTTLGMRLVRFALVRLATLVVHCEAGRSVLGDAGREAHVIPHGSYVGRYPSNVPPDVARARLALPERARVFLCFGQVRPYKGIDELLEAFARIDDPDVRLVIAGEPVGGGTRLLGAVRDRRVGLYLERVADADVPMFFNAADLVVLPYRAVLTSGAAMLALSFGRGVVAPRLGCLAELERTGAAILYDPSAPDGLEQGLRRALIADTGALGAAARGVVRRLSWDAIARRHLAVYGLAPTLSLVRRPPSADAGHASAAREG
jgi:glycosyltransferase involved in cell wall biosynthesis